MPQPKIGYIDERVDESEHLVKFLQLQQLTTFRMKSAAEFEEARKSVEFDLLLYAARLKDRTPIDLSSTIRKISSSPLILLCDFDNSVDRIIAFEAGCDDVVLVPYDTKELVARIRAHIRRNRCFAAGAKAL